MTSLAAVLLIFCGCS